MIRRHFFLAAAICAVALMIVAGGIRLLAPKSKTGGGAAAGGAAAVRTVAVTSARVDMAPFVDRIEVLGVAKGRQSVTLTSNTAELITRLHFHDGQEVRSGQVLADLKSNEQDAGVLQAQAAMDNARRQYQRWETLAEKGVAPRATADDYRAAYEQARATVAAAQARKGDRVIRAPFSGVVGLSDVAPGALINPGTPIVTLDDISLIRVDFDVPDRYLPMLRQGQPIVAHPDAFPGQSVQGRIAMIDTRVDERTRSVKARAEFPNPGRTLKPGMLMRVSIDQGGRQALAAPEAAVQFEGDQAYVYLIANVGGRSIAQRRTVAAGARQNGLIEILQGLSAGDAVVADGVNRVETNQPVKVLTPAGAGARAAP